MSLPNDEKLMRLREQLAGLRAMEATAGWRDVVLPWVAAKATEEEALHEAEHLPPEKRAEHLHSMKILRELRLLVAKTITRLQSDLRALETKP